MGKKRSEYLELVIIFQDSVNQLPNKYPSGQKVDAVAMSMTFSALNDYLCLSNKGKNYNQFDLYTLLLCKTQVNPDAYKLLNPEDPEFVRRAAAGTRHLWDRLEDWQSRINLSKYPQAYAALSHLLMAQRLALESGDGGKIIVERAESMSKADAKHIFDTELYQP